MTTVLGRDFSSRFAARFGGRLYDCSFTRAVEGTPDITDAAGPPVGGSTATYLCSGIAFSYKKGMIDDETILLGDYRVMMLLGTITNDNAAKAELDLADWTDNVDTVVRAVTAGAAGNSISIELVASDAAALTEALGVVSITFIPDVTTVDDVETLIGTSTLIEVKTPGTGATPLASGDALLKLLASGSDATAAPGIVPGPGDTITIPPPNQTSTKTGEIMEVTAITQATVTVQVRGPAL